MMFTKGNFIKLTKSPAGIALAAIFIVVFCAAQDAPAATKKRYENWKGVAADMAVEFEEAQKDIQADHRRGTRQPHRGAVQRRQTHSAGK